jgi:hypothetical protein
LKEVNRKNTVMILSGSRVSHKGRSSIGIKFLIDPVDALIGHTLLTLALLTVALLLSAGHVSA